MEEWLEELLSRTGGRSHTSFTASEFRFQNAEMIAWPLCRHGKRPVTKMEFSPGHESAAGTLGQSPCILLLFLPVEPSLI